MKNINIVFGEPAYLGLKVILPKGSRILTPRDLFAYGQYTHFSHPQELVELRNHQLGILYNLPKSDLGNPMPDELFVHLELLLSADKITIWSAVGIEPQLLKVFIAYFLKLSGQRTKPVEIREFYYVPEYDCVATVVGLLRFEALKQPDAVYQLTPEQVDLYFDIWSAYLAETPEKLFQLLSSIPAENIVVRALRMLSHRYPQPETNLNYWQLAILESISISSTLDDVYTEVLGFDKQPYDFVNEAYVDYLIRLFCYANTVEVGILPDEKPYAATIQLTDYGLNILDGTEKFAFPSDMWVGGALVSSDDFDWRLTAF